ncbi:MAG: PDZ domain-containing protein, partial [Flavobacteriaceae bacterium]|nr:PDZ domain-containing protein [Flavobacteriaceae bacterium]
MFDFRVPFVVAEVDESSLNTEVDLEQGDVIQSINGQEVKYFDQMVPLLTELKAQTVNVELLRDGELIERQLEVNDDGKLGIYPALDPKLFQELGYYEIVRKEYSFGESIGAGYT